MFEAKYSKSQKTAVIQATCDRGVKPYRRVVELAAAGELIHTDNDGEDHTLPPFTIPRDTVASMCQQEQRKRSGRLVSVVADQPPREGLEAMRRRLVSVADREIARLEEATKKKTGAPLDSVTKAARMLRELAAIPGPTDPRPDPPGKGPVSDRTSGELRTGPGADILRAFRGNGDAHQADQEEPSEEAAHPPTPTTETTQSTPRSTTSDEGEQSATHTTTDDDTGQEHDAPGCSPGELIAQRPSPAQRVIGGPRLVVGPSEAASAARGVSLAEE